MNKSIRKLKEQMKLKASRREEIRVKINKEETVVALAGAQKDGRINSVSGHIFKSQF